MKKYLCLFAFLFSLNSAQAQMNEMMGVLGISGAMDSNAYRGVGQMQKALGNVQLQQDIALLVNEIQSAFTQNYSIIDTSLLSFNGLHGIDWNVVPVSPSEFYIYLQNIDASACFIAKNNPWNASRVEINDGQDCLSNDNYVKLYF